MGNDGNEREKNLAHKKNLADHMSVYERISIIRKIHEHEDIVKNHRMMWMLTLQAFLFTAIFVALGNTDIIVNTIFPIILSLVGLISCISLRSSIRYSLKAMDNIKRVYEQSIQSNGNGISEEFKAAILGKVDLAIFPLIEKMLYKSKIDPTAYRNNFLYKLLNPLVNLNQVFDELRKRQIDLKQVNLHEVLSEISIQINIRGVKLDKLLDEILKALLPWNLLPNVLIFVWIGFLLLIPFV